MIALRWLVAIAVAAAAPATAQAGAWTQPKGKGQVILKGEMIDATEGFNPDGQRVPLPQAREDNAIGVFAEYGVTRRLTVQFKGDWQSGQDAFVDYEGRGPLEVGLTWQAYRDDRTAVSLYGGYALAGEGRNAGYAAPGIGEQDWEIRASAGRSLGGEGEEWVGRYAPGGAFVELQTARRMRDGLPDETRVDLTVGGRISEGWLVLGQAFGGATDGDGARWLSVETTVVREYGLWSLQAGWRRTVAGRETPIAQGPVLAVWRRF